MLDLFASSRSGASSGRSSTYGLWPAATALVLGLATLLVLTAHQGMSISNSSTVQLPIEVIGEAGYTTEIQVDVTSTTVDSLYLRVHNLAMHWSEYAENGTDPFTGQPDQERYDEKASFSVNGGPWVGITNERVNCRWPEKHYDCMLGPIGNKTLRLAVAATESGAWQEGLNSIRFRFDATEGISSGYRVLELDVRDGSASVVGNTSFSWVDPDTWSAPYTSQSAIDEGENLWHKRNYLVESPINSKTLVASCADCHTPDGRDLKYFNFSNQSIVARSEFHGLSAEEGRKIASYIRSGDLDLPSGYTVADAGRPWNPPYQPGPNLDDRPVELWAAGAGVDCILNDDNDAANLVVPNDASEPVIESAEHDPNLGVDCNELAEQTDWSRNPGDWWDVANPEGNVNQREWPVAVQYPDIFEWWPDVHPYDLYGVQEAQSNEFVAAAIELRNDLQGGQRDALIEDARQQLPAERGILGKWKKIDRLGSDMGKDGYYDRDPYSSLGTVDHFLERQGLVQWNAMILWHLATKYKLEDQGDEIYGENAAGIELIGAGDRSWFNNQTIYDLSPHKSQKSDDYQNAYVDKGMWRRKKDRKYWGDVWYDVGILLTPGQRISGDNYPIDWNYNHGHVLGNQFLFGDGGRSGQSQMMRYFKHYFVNVQMHTYPEVFPSNGGENNGSWPVSIHKHGWQKAEYADVSFSYRNIYDGDTNAESDLYHRLRETSMRAWLSNSLKYDADEWATTSNNWGTDSKNRLAPKSYEPYLYEGYPYYRILEQMEGEQFANAWVGVLHRYTQDSDIASTTRPTLIDSMAVWGERMWPKYNWEQWMLDRENQTITLPPGWNLISGRVLPFEKDMETVFSGISSNISLVKNEDGEVYNPPLELNGIGDWSPDDGYMVYTTSGVTLELRGIVLDQTRSIALKDGWNLIPFYSTTEQDPVEVFSSIESAIVVVKDQEGNTYVPDVGINDIGMLKPGRSYRIYLESDQTFSYPTSTTSSSATQTRLPDGSR